MNNVNFNLQNILHSSHSIIFFNISFPVITFYKTKITIYIMKPLTFTIFLKGNNNRRNSNSDIFLPLVCHARRYKSILGDRGQSISDKGN